MAILHVLLVYKGFIQYIYIYIYIYIWIHKPVNDLEDVELVEVDPSKVTKVGEELDLPLKEKIVEFLKKNLDIFAWTHEDMLGIDNKVIEYRLIVDPTKKPIQQKRRVFALERNNVVKEEVEKLLIVVFIREFFYPKWLASIVMVKKSNGKWEMGNVRRLYGP